VRVADGSKPKVSIRFNGREVSDPSELPPEMRKLLEDADGNGIPDIAEPGKRSALPGGDRLEIETVTSTVIDLDGKTYQSIDELPAEIREAARAALSQASPSKQPVAAQQPPAEWSPPRPVGLSWPKVLIVVVSAVVAMWLLLAPHH
jgi:hypothetical protein